MIHAAPPPSVHVALIGMETDENLAIRYLAAACERAGLNVAVLPVCTCDELDGATRRVLEIHPRVVGLSVSYQCFARPFLQVAKALRDAGYDGHITAGGHFASLAANRVLRDFPALDSIVMHEGEWTLVEMLHALSAGSAHGSLEQVAGLVFRAADGQVVETPPRALGDLDELAPPVRIDPPLHRLGIGTATMIGSRGCYGSCTYCSIHAWYRTASGPRHRQRSVSDIVSEMQVLYGRGVRIFNFHDDNFFVPSREHNLDRLDAFAEGIRRAGLTDAAIVMKCRPDDLDDEMLDALLRLRLLRVYVGIESASTSGIRSLGRGMKRADIDRAMGALRARDVFHAFNMLIFDPDTTLESILPNLDLMERYADTPFDFSRAEVYVETPLEKRLEKDRRLLGTYFARSYELTDPRADLLFRIVATAFHRRNLESDGMAKLNLAMRMNVQILRLFYPASWDDGIQERAVAFSTKLGLSSVRHLREIRDFASRVDLTDVDTIRAHTADVARSVHHDDFALWTELREIDRDMAARVGIT